MAGATVGRDVEVGVGVGVGVGVAVAVGVAAAPTVGVAVAGTDAGAAQPASVPTSSVATAQWAARRRMAASPYVTFDGPATGPAGA